MRTGGHQLQANRPADVVDDEVKLIELQGVDQLRGPAAETGERVVEVERPAGEPHTGEVGGDAAQAAVGQFGQEFAVEVAGGGNPVEADDRWAAAFFADEGLHASDID